MMMTSTTRTAFKTTSLNSVLSSLTAKQGRITDTSDRVASDRLARIGGFVGAAAPSSRYERENNQYLRQIADNTKHGGTATAVFG